MTNTLLLTLPGIIDAKQKAKLEKRGMLVVETSDLNAVKLVHPSPLMSTDMWVLAALETLEEYSKDYSGTKEKFASRILKAMKDNAATSR